MVTTNHKDLFKNTNWSLLLILWVGVFTFKNVQKNTSYYPPRTSQKEFNRPLISLPKHTLHSPPHTHQNLFKYKKNMFSSCWEMSGRFGDMPGNAFAISWITQRKSRMCLEWRQHVRGNVLAHSIEVEGTPGKFQKVSRECSQSQLSQPCFVSFVRAGGRVYFGMSLWLHLLLLVLKALHPGENMIIVQNRFVYRCLQLVYMYFTWVFMSVIGAHIRVCWFCIGLCMVFYCVLYTFT